ncbi:hypothetical protein AbraIFM66951_006696 [Aspergillus brasiliensis]|uniref:Uncharacterized protein n=1 Tax=Aspergillus brasiliensis TaxID=319629 RepID=A0A9W6DLC6_9EURO|nr:hypothetical protein AbraCBS73388_007410 [Aspergillus brasiliensis]GKZ44492.1 hypothetical protein AbraIFM66951_006696 [Aspergillus brasiliensis]
MAGMFYLTRDDKSLPQLSTRPFEGQDGSVWKLSPIPGPQELYRISAKDQPGEYWELDDEDVYVKVAKVSENESYKPKFAFQFEEVD